MGDFRSQGYDYSFLDADVAKVEEDVWISDFVALKKHLEEFLLDWDVITCQIQRKNSRYFGLKAKCLLLELLEILKADPCIDYAVVNIVNRVLRFCADQKLAVQFVVE